jgi:hypothetical protein
MATEVSVMPAATSSSIHVRCEPEQVYEFVSTPVNWVGTHPVTAAVTAAGAGVCRQSAGEGTRWTELIHDPDGAEPFAVEWVVVVAEPGRRWVIATDRLRVPGLHCRITYTFTAAGGGCDFRRDMTSALPDEATARLYGDALRDPASHDACLANVKTALEG